MKILLVGPKWIGGWLEGVERGIKTLGHEVRTFAYTWPNAPSIDQNKLLMGSYVPSELHPLLLPVAQSIGSMWEDNMNHRLIDVSTDYQADLVILLKGELLQAKTLEMLKISGKRLVSWWLDNPVLYFQDYPQVVSQLKLVDMVFVFDYGCFDELRDFDISDLVYLPCACDPTVYYPKQASVVDQKRFRCDIGFIANYYPERGSLIKQMLGLDVAVWGSG